MTPRARALAFVAALAGAAACDQRADPRITGIRRPPIEAPTGEFTVVAVNDTALPHAATNAGTVYSLASGSLSLHADSSWLASTFETVSSTNGVFIGNSPANYTGTWRVVDSTIIMSPSRGTITVKGDSLFWRGAPRHAFEDTLTFTLVKK